MEDQPLPAKSANEQWYDDEIAPAMVALAEQCKNRGVAMIAVVEFEPGGERGMTTTLPGGCGTAMAMLLHCTQMGLNIDGYVMGLLKFCKDRGIDYSGSVVMRLLDQEAQAGGGT
jgi:hypothetical protein